MRQALHLINGKRVKSSLTGAPEQPTVKLVQDPQSPTTSHRGVVSVGAGSAAEAERTGRLQKHFAQRRTVSRRRQE